MKKVKPPTLRPNEEAEILNDVISKANRGQSVLRQDVIDKVVKFIQSDKRKNPFRNGTPGDKWFCLFRRRHNSHFMKLGPAELKMVEKVGFTEKVMSTVNYMRTLNSAPRQNITTPIKKNPVGRPKLVKPVKATPPQQPVVAVMSPSPLSEDSPHDSTAPDTDDGEMDKSQSDPPDFQPGSRLEVMDFNEKWYPVKVVEVDYDEGEVLVHFEKWSDRYDEWVRMDSNRIRRPMLPLHSVSKKVFEKNERVIAVWAYNHKYPATIREVLPNDKYEVLFCDGYAKILRGCKLFKATEEDLKNCQVPSPKKPAPPMGADPLDPDLGPKEERRLKKRRMDVLEAYRPHKRQKLDGYQSTPESSPQPSTSTSSFRLKETPKVVLKVRGRPPSKHKERGEVRHRYYKNEEVKQGLEEDSDEQVPDTSKSASEKTPTTSIKKQKRKKKLFDESTYFYRGPKQRSGLEENSERWNMEIPEGAAPVQIKDQEGYYRESVIIPDKKMPHGWTKHTMRRKNGAKWDVFLVNPEGRKFRSRNELRNYFSELKQPFPEDCFDFMVGRKLEMIRSQGETRRKLDPDSPLNRSPLHKSSPVHKKSDGEGQQESKKGDSTFDSRRIKTLLPKSRLVEGEDGKQAQSPGASPATPTLTSPPFPLTELRTPDGGFTCCGKNFRKENLFQMHMKHYHPEYSTLFGSTPNVADLAYARTVGEPLEDSRGEAMAPRNSLLERVTRYEAERKAHSETATAVATTVPTGLKNVPEKDSAVVVPPVNEEQAAPVVKETEEQAAPTSVEEVVPEDKTDGEEPKEAEEAEREANEEKYSVTAETSDAPPESPSAEVKKVDPLIEKTEEPTQPVPEEAPSADVSTAPTTLLSVPSTPSIPIIRPVPKLAAPTEPVPNPSASRTLVTITKCMPPGQKPSSSLTKLTISMTTPPSDKEVKPTIKTLLPMRPPPQELKELQEPKELKPKEDSEEETPNKSRPRKRTVSESLPKKPKLVKPPTGSLEEDPVQGEEVLPSPAAANTSYRFSRNRSLPRVSLEKLNITPDSNGRVVLASGSPEDNTAGRRQFNNFKAASKISERPKGGESVSSEPPADADTPVQEVVYENLRKEEIINCTCGYMEEDGLMIQCDLCLCWQHGLCNDIDKESDVPEKYVCHICQNPARQRPSTRHMHSQDWLKEGKLPSLSFWQKVEESVVQRESMLKKSHDYVGSLLQLQTVIRSLRVKTHIATKADHPKLYLWANSWKNENTEVKNGNDENNCNKDVIGPQPEAAIDETECRLRLLEHVEDFQHQVDDRLTSIQAQIAALESEDPDLASDHYPATKQTVQMILYDLNTVRRVAALN